MAKLDLTIKGALSGTNEEISAGTAKKDIIMTTGADHGEGHCSYEVKWTRTTIVTKGIGKSDKKVETGKGSLEFAFSLLNARFMKKMYSPNEIFAEIQIAPGSVKSGDPYTTITYKASVGYEVLEKSLLNKQVELKCDGKTVCNDYYVHELVPVYKSDAMYVTVRMYSPDKLLTLRERCRSYVSKKLVSEIIADEVSACHPPYSPNDKLACINATRHISKERNNTTQEHIFPYLVQYNESFYDFIKRTTNRWGEFLYYEDGKLRVGYEDIPETKILKIEEMADAPFSRTYCDLTSDLLRPDASGHSGEGQDQSQMQYSKLSRGEHDIVKKEINSVGNKAIGGDMYALKKLSNLLVNDKTLWGFLVNEGVEDGISLLKANKFSKRLNDRFDEAYFVKKNKEHVRYDKEQYRDDNTFNEFSEYDAVVGRDEYLDVVKKEVASGRRALVLDFDTSYPDVKLGETISADDKKYLVVQVEGYQPELMQIENNKYFKRVTDSKKVLFKVIAVPEMMEASEDSASVSGKVSKGFYPTLLPTGHVRRSGPQLGRVADCDDPLRQNRVRVMFEWQNPDEDAPTPWLVYITPASTTRGGIHGRHYVDEKVLVAFENGNIESPYVMGGVESNHPDPLKTNSIVCMSQNGQRISMGDGKDPVNDDCAGATALIATMNPALKLIQGFVPTYNFFDSFESKTFEGNIELTDNYGVWSIKGCTNERNISIESPWGDVNINAFTGITISAPNGDVKIKGKNVTIEAGSNLTLTSGTNIKQKFFWEEEQNSLKGTFAAIGMNIAKEVAKKASTKIASLVDLSLFRHTLEIFFKPVEGKLELSSGRYLMLGAGGSRPDYPVDAYKNPKTDEKRDRSLQGMVRSFELVNSITARVVNSYKSTYQACVESKNGLAQLVGQCKNAMDEPQCKTMNEILKAIWQNPNMDDNALKNAIGFKGLFRDIQANEDVEPEFIHAFARRPGNLLLAVLDFRYFEAQAKQEQQNRKNLIIAHAKLMRQNIRELSQGLADFNNKVSNEINQPEPGMSYDTLKSVMKKDNLPKCFIKDTNDAAFEDLRLFNSPAADFDKLLKTIRRTFHVKLLDALEFKRSATEMDVLGLKKASVPAAPKGDCDDLAWAKFVSSVQKMPVPEKPNRVIADAMLDASGIKGWRAFKDDFAYGSSKSGKILFPGQDGTMVLERNIFRANVDHQDIDREEQPGIIRNYTDKVREILLQS